MSNINCDVLIIGGGAAGCRAALSAKEAEPSLRVTLACSGKLGVGGSTNMVASEALGINAPLNAMGDADSPDIYYNDMLHTGGGLADPSLCRIIADESADRIHDLIAYGVVFNTTEHGGIKQVKLSGCSKARSLVCGGSTGKEIVEALWRRAAAIGVELLENMAIFELLRDADGCVCGARGICKGEEQIIYCRSLILATGGAGAVFQRNVTPNTQNGDGWAMAYACGCSFVNMEFFQIGPAIATASGMKYIIHSHMWSLMPIMRNGQGKQFLHSYCPTEVQPEEAVRLKAMSYPFSVRTDAKYVDIAIFREIMAGRNTPNGGVWFDVTHAGKARLAKVQPITYEHLLHAGIDLAREPVELTLAVQNFNGGVQIDENGFTGVRGLYAAGEVTGGVHGSDRPGGNNLTDTQVFGHRAGRSAAQYAAGLNNAAKPIRSSQAKLRAENDRAVQDEIAKVFYKNLTIVRNATGLKNTLAFIEEASGLDPSQAVQNRLIVGRLIAQAALTRAESRGTHYREDYPKTDAAWDRRIVLNKASSTREN